VTVLYLEDRKGNVPIAGSSRSPLTPASSTVSRRAAFSTTSSCSQPPLGKTKPLPDLLVMRRTSMPSGADVPGLSLMGMQPATRRSPDSLKRCV